MDIHEESREFSRIAGEVLAMALTIESYLENFIYNYFISDSHPSKKFFFNDLMLINLGFTRKIDLFKDICKRERFNNEEISKVLSSIYFIKNVRDKVAHWEREKHFDKPLRLRKRTSSTTKDDILELNEKLLKELDEHRVKAINGIGDFEIKYLREGTIDERPNDWKEFV